MTWVVCLAPESGDWPAPGRLLPQQRVPGPQDLLSGLRLTGSWSCWMNGVKESHTLVWPRVSAPSATSARASWCVQGTAVRSETAWTSEERASFHVLAGSQLTRKHSMSGCHFRPQAGRQAGFAARCSRVMREIVMSSSRNGCTVSEERRAATHATERQPARPLQASHPDLDL